MRGRRGTALWLTVAVVAVVAAVVAVQKHEGPGATLLGIAALVLAAAAFIADRKGERAGNTAVVDSADRLADQVGRSWSVEASKRGLNQPPLEVSWIPADGALSQSWSYLQTLARAGCGWQSFPQAAAGPQALTGAGGQLRQTWEQVPTRRLVVLGEPGSGKTMLLVGLVLDLLKRRKTEGGPVPLLIPLTSFDPGKHSLDGWLEKGIIRDYPWLKSRMASGASLARALLDAGMIIPILDGLDEIHVSRRAEAIRAINMTVPAGRGLILSCRKTEFRHAIRPTPGQLVHLEAATAIELRPLQPDTVAGYLTATAGSLGDARWTPVIAALTAVPAPPAAQALSTPLMASLARTIYNPRSGESAVGLPNPADLCDTTVFPTRTAVEEYLFDGFIPLPIGPTPTIGIGGPPIRPPLIWSSSPATSNTACTPPASPGGSSSAPYHALSGLSWADPHLGSWPGSRLAPHSGSCLAL